MGGENRSRLFDSLSLPHQVCVVSCTNHYIVIFLEISFNSKTNIEQTTSLKYKLPF